MKQPFGNIVLCNMIIGNKKCIKTFQEIVDKCKCLRYNNICVVGSAELHIGRG